MKASFRRLLAASTAVLALAAAGESAAQQRVFNLPAQRAATAIPEFARQAGVQITAPAHRVADIRTPELRGEMDVREGLRRLLVGTGLEVAADQGGIITLRVRAAAADDDPVAAVDEVVVVGQRASERRAVDIKRAAIGVMDAAAADDIGELPDRNVAEVVERLPAVGVQYDQGEGRYVAIRGVPSNLNNYTINGFEIGNPDGGTRRLPLDVVSGQLLNRVEISKVKTADQDGQGIGGAVNLVTQTAFDFADDRVAQGSIQLGHQELNGKTAVRGEFSLGGRFGDGDQFGVLLGVSYSDRTFASYGVYPDDWGPVDGLQRGAPINIKYTDYSLSRERIGAIASFDWRPGGATDLYARVLYSRFTEDEYRQRYRLDFGTEVLNADGRTGSSTDTEIRQDLRLEYKEKSILTGMVGGRTVLDAWRFDYGLARSHNEVIEPNQVWQFRANPGTVDFDLSDRLFTAAPRDPVTAAMLGFRQYQEQDTHGEEDIWAARFDAQRDLARGSNDFIRFGLKYRSTDKVLDDAGYTWARGSAANRFTMADFDLDGPAVTVRPGHGRAYPISPTLNAEALIAFTAANLDSARFVLNQAGALANGVLNDLDLTEEVAAAYATANLSFGAVTVTPGLRVERTDIDLTGYQLENETDVVRSQQSNSYTDVLPSLIVRFEPREDVVIRAAYARSLGRPEYADMTPGGEVGYEDNGDGTFDGSVSLGNPALEPYRSDALDLTAEWYFAPGGLLSVGAFYKDIDNPIYTATEDFTDIVYGGRTYADLTLSQRRNGESAELTGLEAAWQQQFDFLPGFWSGFGVNANIAWVNSRLTVAGRAGDTPFPEQSDLLYGARLFYQTTRVEASVAYHHTGSALIGLGGTPMMDSFNDDLRRLDAKASFRVSDRLTLFIEGQNLTDEPTRQYQGGRTDWVTQEERYGRVFTVGASARW